MDWAERMGTEIWLFPRGMERHGAAGPASCEWKSRYGSVVTSAYDSVSTDGLNEAGLVANMLWLTESQYPVLDGSAPTLSLAAWAQYVLDSFSTVAEAVAALEAEPFVVRTADVPGQDRSTTLHMSISDETGDSAIFEYLDGRLQIHHSAAYSVMTNSPPYAEQLSISTYWEQLGGDVMLPGTGRASDRFVRAKYYTDSAVPMPDAPTAAAAALAIIRNVSVPFREPNIDSPYLSSTHWRTMADHKDRRYYFDSAYSPSVVWVDLQSVDVTEGSGARRLGLSQSTASAGDLTDKLEAAEPFEFAPVTY